MILKEYEFIQYRDENKKNFIKKATFEELEKFILENETANYLKITMKKGFGKVLQAQNYVGLIQTKNGTTIEILPKIKNKNDEKLKKLLLKMLKTLKNSPFKSFNTAQLKNSKMPLLEIFISMFLEEVDKLIKRGIKNDYIQKEKNLKFLKGKLKLKEQIKKNFIHKERFFVEYDEFISDRIENRIIKTTLKYLYKKSRLNKNQKRIREFLFIFDKVKECKNIKIAFDNIKLNRQMKDYENIILWARIFLFRNSFTPYKGKNVAFALLFDMNKLFESYVYDFLKKICKNIKAQHKKHYLVYENQIKGKFSLIPDIVIDDGKIIMDTKWKILNEEKDINQSDIYQMYAYATKYKNCKKVCLVYPKNKEAEYKKYFFKKTDENPGLEIMFFDLFENKFYPELNLKD
jgi:5-methylcytosine-specific restriction enzyme subunit McrC